MKHLCWDEIIKQIPNLYQFISKWMVLWVFLSFFFCSMKIVRFPACDTLPYESFPATLPNQINGYMPKRYSYGFCWKKPIHFNRIDDKQKPKFPDWQFFHANIHLQVSPENWFTMIPIEVKKKDIKHIESFASETYRMPYISI